MKLSEEKTVSEVIGPKLRERNRCGKREISNGVIWDLKPIAPLLGNSVI